MSINESLLIDAVRNRPEIYDKKHPGFKNVPIKEAAWKNVADAVNASVEDCAARWQNLRERFGRERRLQEQATRSGSSGNGYYPWIHFESMSFMNAHVIKRKSIDNLQKKKKKQLGPSLNPSSTTTSEGTADEDTASDLIDFSSSNLLILEESVDEPMCISGVTSSTPQKVDSLGASKASAVNLPYFGSTSRPKRHKSDETTILFKETLAKLGKSLSTQPSEARQLTDVDATIAHNLELTLKPLPMQHRLKYRRKIRDLLQECEGLVFDFEGQST